MTRTDPAYALTRRRGAAGVITRVTGVSSDPETGVKTPTTSSTTIRFMYREPTQYSRLFRAQATQQRIGETTFIVWTPDFPPGRVSVGDYITYGGIRYEVNTSTIEDRAMIITATEFV